MADVDWRELPGIRKVGRYLFFALCAFGVSTVVYVVAQGLGCVREISRLASSAALFVVFFVLRDMSMHWAWALKVQAAAIEEAERL